MILHLWFRGTTGNIKTDVIRCSFSHHAWAQVLIFKRLIAHAHAHAHAHTHTHTQRHTHTHTQRESARERHTHTRTHARARERDTHTHTHTHTHTRAAQTLTVVSISGIYSLLLSDFSVWFCLLLLFSHISHCIYGKLFWLLLILRIWILDINNSIFTKILTWWHTYRLIQKTMCKYTYIYSVHTVYYKDILTVINTRYTLYVHILYFVHVYTHNNIWRCGRLYIIWIHNVVDVRWMVSSGSR